MATKSKAKCAACGHAEFRHGRLGVCLVRVGKPDMCHCYQFKAAKKRPARKPERFARWSARGGWVHYEGTPVLMEVQPGAATTAAASLNKSRRYFSILLPEKKGPR